MNCRVAAYAEHLNSTQVTSKSPLLQCLSGIDTQPRVYSVLQRNILDGNCSLHNKAACLYRACMGCKALLTAWLGGCISHCHICVANGHCRHAGCPSLSKGHAWLVDCCSSLSCCTCLRQHRLQHVQAACSGLLVCVLRHELRKIARLS